MVRFPMLLLLLAALCTGSAFVTVPLARRPLTTSALAAARSLLPASRGPAMIPLSNYLLAEYTTKVSVGAPPASFRMVLDTASGNTWLPTAGCSDYVANPVRFSSQPARHAFLGGALTRATPPAPQTTRAAGLPLQ